MSIFKGEATLEEIRARFDNDVERFSNLETGQTAAMDAPLALELIARAAHAVNPKPKRVLDLGCGAGNFTLRLLQLCPDVEEVVLVDLSQPMLDRAKERIQTGRQIQVECIQGDIRNAPFDHSPFDVILAGAVLHHLRTDDDWDATFTRIFRSTAPGGSFWIFDLITHRHPAIQQLMWHRYGDYLTALNGDDYREKVFAYSQYEDSPRSVPEQLQLLSKVGFGHVELLHANGCFAAFGAIHT